jgi:hypothetical protein
VLTEEDLELYEDLKKRTLEPEAIAWLEGGALEAGYPSEI